MVQYGLTTIQYNLHLVNFRGQDSCNAPHICEAEEEGILSTKIWAHQHVPRSWCVCLEINFQIYGTRWFDHNLMIPVWSIFEEKANIIRQTFVKLRKKYFYLRNFESCWILWRIITFHEVVSQGINFSNDGTRYFDHNPMKFSVDLRGEGLRYLAQICEVGEEEFISTKFCATL